MATLPEPALKVANDGAGTAGDSVNFSLSSTVSVPRVPAELDDAPDFVGRYRLAELVGCGAFGEVWKAYDPDLRRTVAIKLLRADREWPASAREAFRREAQCLAAIRHASVIEVFDVGCHLDRPYFVAEWMAGGSLADRRQEYVSRPFAERAELLAQIAEGVHEVHKRGLIHRDLKPANILFDGEGRPKLGDFGLAVSEHELFGEPGSVVGTVKYMSPEQAAGKSNRVSVQSDVYSLGAILFELLTGRAPFAASNSREYRAAILEATPRTPRTIDPNIPAALEHVCLRCLRRDPDDRYAAACDVAEALRGAAAPEFPIDELRSTGGNRFALAAAGIGVLLIVALVVTWALGFFAGDSPSQFDGNSESSGHTAAVRESDETSVPLADWFPLPKGMTYLSEEVKYDAESQVLTIDSERTVLVGLHEASSTGYDVRASFSLGPRELGEVHSAGVLFGFRSQALDDTRMRSEYQSIEIVRPGTTSPVTVKRLLHTATHAPGEAPNFTKTPLESVQIADVTTGTLGLNLSVRNQRLVKVSLTSLGEDALDPLCSSGVNQAVLDPHYQGASGITNSDGTLQLREFSFQPHQE